MFKNVVLSGVVVLFCTAVCAEDKISVPQKLQTACVTVKDDYRDRGSGVVITNEVDGKRVHWILTVEHVVDGFREVKTVIGPKGEERKKVSYRSPVVAFEEREATRYAGKTLLEAEVVSADGERDLALLRVQKTDRIKGSIFIFKGKDTPAVGTDLYHCASPGGDSNAASLTAGIICQHGRVFEREGFGKCEYDQMDAAGLPGSSGGMVCLKSNGELIGLVSLGMRNTDNFHYFVPVRTIKEWLKEIKAEWLLDPKAKITEADVKKIPLELTGLDLDDEEKPTPAKKKEQEEPKLEIAPAVISESADFIRVDLN